MLETLVASNWIVLDKGRWASLFTKLASAYHPADFWLASGEPKPVSVADLRQLKQFAAQTPVGTGKLAILAGAHNWRQEVANGLLKLLEEPPTYLKILIVGESSQLLPTLASRVQQLNLKLIEGNLELAQDKDSTMQRLQSCLQGFDLDNLAERQAAQTLLYYQPALHSNLNADVVLEGFSKQAYL